MKRTQKLVKLTVLAALALVLNMAARGQEHGLARKDVPQAVLDAFARAYPKAPIQGYFREVDSGQTVYEIESVEGETARDAMYSADGKLILVEESLSISELPAVVRDALDKIFPAGRF